MRTQIQNQQNRGTPYLTMNQTDTVEDIPRPKPLPRPNYYEEEINVESDSSGSEMGRRMRRKENDDDRGLKVVIPDLKRG